jgi:hypothetical protein
MECEHCHKTFSTQYVLNNHKKNTKSCLIIQGKPVKIVEKKNPTCSYCSKVFKSNQNLKNHLGICKKKPNEELLSVIEDKIDRLQQSVLSKDEHNKKLEERIKELEEKVKQPTIINNSNNSNNNNQVNNQVYNNNLTIHNYMTPERVTEVFDKHYTIETLMGGQKALANFVVDQFVAGPDKMVYLCVDRSRKKCMYTTDFQTFHEDVNNEILLSQLTPAMHIIKDKVEWSEMEKKYNMDVERIHDSFDEILAIRDDGCLFRSQLCKRLPTTIEDKKRMDGTSTLLDTLEELRQEEETKYMERKKEIDLIVTKTEEEQLKSHEAPREPNNIAGLPLHRLSGLRKLYRDEGVFKIHNALKESVEKDEEVAIMYEEYIKTGYFKGDFIF